MTWRPLYQTVEEPKPESTVDEEEEAIDPSSWRATSQEEELNGKVLGSLVHKALHRWCFPGDPHLEKLLQKEALQAGLVNEIQRGHAVERAIELLDLLRQHPIWVQIDAAAERHHELPYAVQVGGRTENRYIDLLYRDGDNWQIIDFKTDPILTLGYREDLIIKYTPQVQRYRRAVKQLLGVDTRASICFFNNHSLVSLLEVV